VAGFEDRIAVERKTAEDLISCLMGDNRQRFERELAKAKSYDTFLVIIEASLQDIAEGRYRSAMKPHAALQSIAAMMIRHRVSFLFAGNREGGEYMTFSIFQKYLAEIEKRYKQAQKAEAA
jgi:DNA excision repair protein ERCC-4